ncbi:hypothetical protein MTO96_005835 [Rhipicephalus appendiculatus]
MCRAAAHRCPRDYSRSLVRRSRQGLLSYVQPTRLCLWCAWPGISLASSFAGQQPVGTKSNPAAAVQDKTASIITRGPCLFFQGRSRAIKSHGAPAPRARLPLYPNSRTGD